MDNKITVWAYLKEYAETKDEILKAVTDVFESGTLILGQKGKDFERAYSDYIGTKFGVGCDNGTNAIWLALKALGIKAGDEVIVPTLTFTATAEVVRYLGAHPVFIDCDPNTLNIDVKLIEKAITSKTKAIVPVHFAGLACDMDTILAIAKKYDLKVVEDAAHAFPTFYKGKLIGTLDSDVTVFSFYANKTMTTGEGGMLVSKNKQIIERSKIMRLHGISRDAFDRYQSKTPAWYYEVIEPGFKYNLPDIIQV